MLFFYRLALFLYTFLLQMATPFHTKARLWTQGRKNWKTKAKTFQKKNKVFWIHCASLGEFESGRPLIEALKTRYPDWQCVLTFFSPSGYEVRKHFPLADWVGYLPMDSPQNARDFIHHFQPDLVFFVKYEHWYYYLAELNRRKIPCYLAAASIRAGSSLFRWPQRVFFQKTLALYSHIFVQKESSVPLLRDKFGLENVTESGDTRMDRVWQTAQAFQPLPQIERFIGSRFCVVCGSTWPADEKFILRAIQHFANEPRLCWIIAPHHVDSAHVQPLKNKLGKSGVLFSEWEKSAGEPPVVLIIDNIGMLARLYHYAGLAWIGGGFGVSVHNTLEAAVYGVRLLFGPHHQKFTEAAELIAIGGAKEAHDQGVLINEIELALQNPKAYQEQARISANYVQENTGACEIILSKIAQSF